MPATKLEARDGKTLIKNVNHNTFKVVTVGLMLKNKVCISDKV